MAIPKRKMTPDDLNKLRKKIDSKSWNIKWRALFTEVDEQNKNLPPLSDAEIAAEVDAAREEMKAKRSSSLCYLSGHYF